MIEESRYSNKFNDREEFEKQVKDWLYNKSHEQRKPYYHFLAIISLINLDRLRNLNLEEEFQGDIIRKTYILYRTTLILSYFVHANEDDILNYIASADAIASDVASIFTTSIYATVSAAAYMIHGITNTFSTKASSASIENSAQATATAALTAVAGNNLSVKYFDLINMLWSAIIEEDEMVVSGNVFISLVSELREQVLINMNALLNVGLSFLHEDLRKIVNSLFGINENKISSINLVKYFKHLDLSAFISVEQLKETLLGESDSARVRALIIGSGGSGKTSLFQLLTGQTVKESNIATTEIGKNTICDCTTKWIIDNPFSKSVDLCLWDFAGQTQYYGLHQSFFTNRCLYILVIDSRHQQSPYDWLQQVSIMSGNNNAHIVILVNKYENCPSQLNISDLKSRFKNLNITKDSIYEINLGSFKGLNILDSNFGIRADTKNHEKLKYFLIALVKASEKVQTQMSINNLNFYNEINESIENKKHFFTSRDIRAIAQKYERTEDYRELLESFGNLIETRGEKVIWLSGQWLNNVGYELLYMLQSGESKNAYSYDDIVERIETDSSIDMDENSFDLILKHFYQSSLAVNNSKDKIIFPAILSTNDPSFLDILNDSREYILYASFNIHIDFMQMGIFSRWLAEWLSESRVNTKVELKEGNFSRFCCIISTKIDSLENNVTNKDSHLLIKWHPHYRVLDFSFYYPVEELSNNIKECINSFNDLLHMTLTTISSKKYSSSTRHTNIICDRYPLSEEMTAKFLLDLKNISQKGLIYHYFNQSFSKGNINVENINNAHNQTIIETNNGMTQTADNINNITINDIERNNFINALSKLEEKYRKENINESNKVNNLTKVIDAAKADVELGNLTEEKVSILEKIAEGIDTANPILTYVQGLFSLYAVVAGLV